MLLNSSELSIDSISAYLICSVVMLTGKVRRDSLICLSSHMFPNAQHTFRNHKADPTFNRPVFCFRRHIVHCTAHDKQPKQPPDWLQSPSIKTLCLAYKNKIQSRAEYQIRALENKGFCYLATVGM